MRGIIWAAKGMISYIDITITILDIIQLPVFSLKHSISETGFCLRLQVIPTQLGLVDRVSIRVRRQIPVSETSHFK
jgi:hypothetical protein